MLAHKLDYLMRLTNTKNSDLAKALGFDPSYISRMRSGKRGLPNHQPFIEPASRFFARKITEDYQKKSLSETILQGKEWPGTEEDVRIVIAAWLNDTGPVYSDSISRFLARISKLDSMKANMFMSSLPHADAIETPGGREIPVRFYYGSQGKRDAVLQFMAAVAASGKPVEIWFLSDESSSWITESRHFITKWGSLVMQIIHNGGRFKVIHSLDLNYSEMLDSIERWLPIYMTGAVEPWYCPHLRDRIFRRTLMIAPGSMALLGNSTRTQLDGLVNFLIQEPGAVKALERDFQDYLSICRPLMEIRPIHSLTEVPSDLDDYRYHYVKMDQIPRNIDIHVDEEKGLAITHLSSPYLFLHTKEHRIVQAFMDFWMMLHG